MNGERERGREKGIQSEGGRGEAGMVYGGGRLTFLYASMSGVRSM